jgi:hypothetical protein
MSDGAATGAGADDGIRAEGGVDTGVEITLDRQAFGGILRHEGGVCDGSLARESLAVPATTDDGTARHSTVGTQGLIFEMDRRP